MNTRTHAAMDYLVGVLLIAAPYLLGFANGGPEQWTPQLLGLATLIMSVITRYELSLAKIIPFPIHLGIDALSGALLLVSPWLFGFADRIWWPHVAVGAVELVVVVLTLGAARKGTHSSAR